MSAPQLRPYQRECVDAIWKHVGKSPLPAVAVLPTGAGKSLVIAQIVKDTIGWNGRIAVLQHVKELVEQNATQISRLAPEVSMGIYSAGLGSRDVGYPVTVAGIQSVYSKAEVLGKLDVILVDEAHRIPAGDEGMYRTFLNEALKLNPNARLLGLTATPFRLSTGMIYGPGQLFEKVVYEAYVRKLILDGYLSPLRSKTTTEAVDVSNVSVRGGEFVAGELQAAMMTDLSKLASAVLEIGMKTQDRRSVIIFCTGIDHATTTANYLREFEMGEVREVYGDTPDEERARTIREFREGKVKFLVNVDVLTTGFDAPGVDCVSILRPTMSPGLFYQMVGRGFRLAPEKKDCLVLDFGGNLMRHGPVDRMLIGETPASGGRAPVSPWKACPDCMEVLPRSAGVCLACGRQFVREDGGVKHDGKTGDKDILSGPEDVKGVEYGLHVKEKDGKPSRTLKVSYDVGYMYPVCEWVCVEHVGFARTKAETWWRQRSDKPCPRTVEEALQIINTEGIKEPKQLTLRAKGKFWRIDKYVDLQPGKPVAWTWPPEAPGEDVAF